MYLILNSLFKKGYSNGSVSKVVGVSNLLREALVQIDVVVANAEGTPIK